MPSEQNVLAAIDQVWIADQTERLVRIPSVTLHEQEVCNCYKNQLQDPGLEVDCISVFGGNPNACKPGSNAFGLAAMGRF